MTKRARGSVRPGQRRPIQRRPAGSEAEEAVVASRAAGLSDEELRRAAELEAQLVAQERAAEDARRRTRERSASREEILPGGSLARAHEEYAYVARDVRRIARIAALLFAILFGSWWLLEASGLVTLG